MNPHDTPHPSICEARGWWALYQRRNHTVVRVRVAAWMTVHETSGGVDCVYPQAMVAGDGPNLTPADHDTTFMFLWHDGDSYCYCCNDPRPPSVTDDIYWCEECIGEIR